MKLAPRLLPLLALSASASAQFVCPPAPPSPPGSGGGTDQPAPSTPSPSAPAPAPSTPTPNSTPSTPPAGRSGPASPPCAPASPGSARPGPISGGTPGTGVASTPGTPEIGGFGMDALHWSHWWYLESARFLDLRTVVQGPPASGGRRISSASPLAPSRRVVEERVLPALLAVAEAGSRAPDHDSALIALGRLTTADSAHFARVLDVLRSGLAEENTRQRESAILGLGLLAHAESDELLFALLADGAEGRALLRGTSVPERVRAFAAYGLGLSAHRAGSTEAAQRIGAEAITALEKGSFAASDLSVALVTAIGLVELPETPTLPAEDVRKHPAVDHVVSSRALTRYLRAHVLDAGRGRAELRAHAGVAYARAASRAGESLRARAIADLIVVAEDRSSQQTVRTGAIVALGEVARSGEAEIDRVAREALLGFATDGQPLERRFALIAASSAAARPGHGESSFAGAEDVLAAMSRHVRRGRAGDLGWAALALGSLEHTLAEHGVEPTRAAIAALEEMGSKRRADDESAALGIGLALAARNSRHAEGAVAHLAREFAETGTPELRGNIALALGILGRAEARELLRAELPEARNQPLLLWSSALGLGLLGENASAELVARLRETRSIPEQVALSAALGQIGTRKTVEPLIELIGNALTDDRARASAIDALGSICDLERMPWRDPIAHALPYFAITPVLRSDGDGVLERAW